MKPQIKIEEQIKDYGFNKEEVIFSKKNNNELTEEDKKIEFLLENGLLVNVAQIEECGYKLKDNYKKEYYKKLYKQLLDNPDETLKTYLNNDLELENHYLSVLFLMDLQERKRERFNLSFSKIATSFLDKIKKGLDNDPVARYKYHKLEDKEFINYLFDVWYEMGKKHLSDIETNITNPTKFWIFKFKKSEKRMLKDIEYFNKNLRQRHILNTEDFFGIPFENDIFSKHVKMEKMLKCKDLIKKHGELREKIRGTINIQREIYFSEMKLLTSSYEESILEKIEKTVRNHYQEEHMELVEDIKAVVNDDYLQKVVTRKMIKGVDDQLMKDLSAETLNIIESIKNKSSVLYEKDIDLETKEMISFLWQDKMPEIIKKYLNVDPEYRKELKNIQGKNAEELMIESLNIIKESLERIEKDINEENLKNLSIHTRYLKQTFKG